jgi:malate dehydrogenase (oxaloacetate-decarboxylating)
MDEAAVFPQESADVAMQAIADGVARKPMSWQEAFDKAQFDITEAREMTKALQDHGFIKQPPRELIEEALECAIDQIGCKKGKK